MPPFLVAFRMSLNENASLGSGSLMHVNGEEGNFNQKNSTINLPITLDVSCSATYVSSDMAEWPPFSSFAQVSFAIAYEQIFDFLRQNAILQEGVEAPPEEELNREQGDDVHIELEPSKNEVAYRVSTEALPFDNLNLDTDHALLHGMRVGSSQEVCFKHSNLHLSDIYSTIFYSFSCSQSLHCTSLIRT